jgi:hypothetical protein
LFCGRIGWPRAGASEFPAARIELLRRSGAMLSFGVHRIDLVLTAVVFAGLLLSITMIRAY